MSSAWNGTISVTSTSANTMPDPRNRKRANPYPAMVATMAVSNPVPQATSRLFSA